MTDNLDIAPLTTLPRVNGRTLLVDTPGAVVGLKSFAPGEVFANHYHARADEIFVVLDGELTLWEDRSRRTVLRAGDTARCAQRHHHRIANDTDAPARMMFVKSNGDPDDIVWIDWTPPATGDRTKAADDVAGRFFPAVIDPDRVVVLDSATHTHRHVAASGVRPGHEVIVGASYLGVYCARLLQEAQPKAVIGLDCGIGKDGAGISGLWYFEALNVPAAAADITNLEHGNGRDLYDHGIISRVNALAEAAGVRPGQTVTDAADILLSADVAALELDRTNREVVDRGPNGRAVVCTNSIADALPEDKDTNVLCTAGHTGRSVIEYILGFRPYGFICSDGAMGRDGSGIAALQPAQDAGIAGAAVSADSARMGDGHSTYYDGIVSAANQLALDAGVTVGMPATQAARLLLERR